MIRAMVRLALIAVGAALTLSGCVSTAYGPTGDGRPYGYSERKREDGSYILRVSHPDEGLALTYWDQRAVELCGSTAYVKNIYQSIRPTMAYSNYGGMPGLVQLEGLFASRGVTLLRLPGKQDRPDLYYRVDGHWNAAGHRHVAETLLPVLSDPSRLRK